MKLMIILFLVVGVLIGADYWQTMRLIRIGKDLAQKAVPFSRDMAGAKMKIIIIGDSTAVGTGAVANQDSIAGRVNQTFPQAELQNLGVNGAKTKELVGRLETLTDKSVDLLMIHIGGNDIVRFTKYQELEESIVKVLDIAVKKARHVTLTTSGNMGTAKLLPWGTRWIFTKRTRKVREIFQKAAKKQGVLYIDLFREKNEDPFAQDPDIYYAADFFHPSSAGYGDWYKIIEKTLKQVEF